MVDLGMIRRILTNAVFWLSLTLNVAGVVWLVVFTVRRLLDERR